jgi:predicted amidohydrolase YtcJ
MSHCDLVLLGGDVRTFDAGARTASAVAIADGRIVAVGSDDEVREGAGSAADVVDLGGRTVLPGINDSHAHVGWWALATAAGALDVRPGSAPSVAAVQELVREAADRTPEGEWILGYGWDQTRFAEGRLPTRTTLDAVAPRHPVALTHFSGHALWANSEALRRAGVERSTSVPRRERDRARPQHSRAQRRADRAGRHRARSSPPPTGAG